MLALRGKMSIRDDINVYPFKELKTIEKKKKTPLYDFKKNVQINKMNVLNSVKLLLPEHSMDVFEFEHELSVFLRTLWYK